MENNENTNLSLRDAIEAGFERVAAEEEGAEQAAANSPETAVETGAAEGTDGQMELGSSEATGSTADNAETNSPEAPAATPAAPQNAESMLAVAMQMIRDIRAENARLNQALEQQGAAMNQQSQMAEQAVEESVTAPQIPELDFSQLQYMNDEDRAAAMGAWQNAIMEQAVAKVRAEFAPVKADYEAKNRIAAENAAKSTIFGDPRFKDFGENSADIDRIASSSVFKDATPEQKYLYAGLIARGMRHDPMAKPSTDDIVKMVMANPDALKAIETRRAQEIRDKNADLPVLSGSSGMSGANPVPQNRVTSREELDSRIAKRFGL